MTDIDNSQMKFTLIEKIKNNKFSKLNNNFMNLIKWHK